MEKCEEPGHGGNECVCTDAARRGRMEDPSGK